MSNTKLAVTWFQRQAFFDLNFDLICINAIVGSLAVSGNFSDRLFIYVSTRIHKGCFRAGSGVVICTMYQHLLMILLEYGE